MGRVQLLKRVGQRTNFVDVDQECVEKTSRCWLLRVATVPSQGTSALHASTVLVGSAGPM